MRYFELFAIPVDYNIDLATINKHYLELQRAVHPDRHANASSRDKLMADKVPLKLTMRYKR